MLQAKIRPIPALIVLVAVAIAALGFSDRLAEAKTTTPIHKITMSECIRCHPDAATIAKMQYKSGDNRFSYENVAKQTGLKCPTAKAAY